MKGSRWEALSHSYFGKLVAVANVEPVLIHGVDQILSSYMQEGFLRLPYTHIPQSSPNQRNLRDQTHDDVRLAIMRRKSWGLKSVVASSGQSCICVDSQTDRSCRSPSRHQVKPIVLAPGRLSLPFLHEHFRWLD